MESMRAEVAECEEQAHTVGQLKAQKAELEKSKTSLQSEVDKEKEEKIGLQKAVEDSQVSFAQLQQALEAEREANRKLQTDLSEAESAIMKEHVNGFSRVVKQLKRFNPNADFSLADVDKDFNKDGILVPLSELEDEEEVGQEEEGVEEQAAEDGGTGAGETALTDPSFSIPPSAEDDPNSTPVGIAVHGDAHE